MYADGQLMSLHANSLELSDAPRLFYIHFNYDAINDQN